MREAADGEEEREAQRAEQHVIDVAAQQEGERIGPVAQMTG